MDNQEVQLNGFFMEDDNSEGHFDFNMEEYKPKQIEMANYIEDLTGMELWGTKPKFSVYDYHIVKYGNRDNLMGTAGVHLICSNGRVAMKYEEMSELLEETIFPEIRRIREAGQKEYARNSNDVLANFKRVSKWLGISTEQVIGVYMLKHIDGITSFINGHKSQREDVTGRLTDVIVYSTLLWALTKEEKDSK
jgi:hypothetical protein